MFRWLGVLSVCVLSSMVVASPVSAAPPDKMPVPFLETFTGLEGVCDVPITIAFDTRQTQRTWLDKNGEATRVHVTGQGSVTVINEETGVADTVSASGPTIGTKGVGSWFLVATEAQAEFVPIPPGAWLYKGKIADLNAPDYRAVFNGRIVDLCEAVQ